MCMFNCACESERACELQTLQRFPPLVNPSCRLVAQAVAVQAPEVHVKTELCPVASLSGRRLTKSRLGGLPGRLRWPAWRRGGAGVRQPSHCQGCLVCVMAELSPTDNSPLAAQRSGTQHCVERSKSPNRCHQTLPNVACV